MADTFRTHVPPHQRSIQEQTLDALLRIEEVLNEVRSDFLNERMEKQVEAMAPTAPAKEADKSKGGRGGSRRL